MYPCPCPRCLRGRHQRTEGCGDCSCQADNVRLPRDSRPDDRTGTTSGIPRAPLLGRVRLFRLHLPHQPRRGRAGLCELHRSPAAGTPRRRRGCARLAREACRAPSCRPHLPAHQRREVPLRPQLPLRERGAVRHPRPSAARPPVRGLCRQEPPDLPSGPHRQEPSGHPGDGLPLPALSARRAFVAACHPCPGAAAGVL